MHGGAGAAEVPGGERDGARPADSAAEDAGGLPTWQPPLRRLPAGSTPPAPPLHPSALPPYPLRTPSAPLGAPS
eukprot:436835-Prorocentrum_minimum.AAC.1